MQYSFPKLSLAGISALAFLSSAMQPVVAESSKSFPCQNVAKSTELLIAATVQEEAKCNRCVYICSQRIEEPTDGCMIAGDDHCVNSLSLKLIKCTKTKCANECAEKLEKWKEHEQKKGMGMGNPLGF